MHPYHYEPWGERCFGFLQLVDHPDFSSGHARPDLAPGDVPDDDAVRTDDCQHWDRLSHSEVFFTFPAARYRRTPDNLLVDKKLVWIQPFYFDNSSYVMFSSREIWGIEREMAHIDIEQGEAVNELHIDVAIDGFKKFDPDSVSHKIGVMHLRMSHDSAPTLLGTERDNDKNIELIIESLKGYLPDDWLGDATGKSLSLPTFKINTLKQYRGVFDMHDAAYRAIIASTAEHTNIKDMSAFKGDHVSVNFYWSDSMKEQFETLFNLEEPPPEAWDEWFEAEGQRVSKKPAEDDWQMPSVRLPVHLAVFFRSDAKYDVMGTLYTYGGGPQYPPPEGIDPAG